MFSGTHLPAVSLSGKQAEADKAVVYAVLSDRRADKSGFCLNIFRPIAHGNPCSGGLQHIQIILSVAEGNGIFRRKGKGFAKTEDSIPFAAVLGDGFAI